MGGRARPMAAPPARARAAPCDLAFRLGSGTQISLCSKWFAQNVNVHIVQVTVTLLALTKRRLDGRRELADRVASPASIPSATDREGDSIATSSTQMEGKANSFSMRWSSSARTCVRAAEEGQPLLCYNFCILVLSLESFYIFYSGGKV